VNRFWMCDDGMLSYKRNHEDRIEIATVGRAPVRRFATTDDALENAARLLGETPEGARAVVLSAVHSTEDNLALAALAKAWGASLFLAHRPDWEGDTILRSDDQNPNRKGATLAADGASLGTLDDLIDAASKGTVKGLVVLGAASTRSADEMKPFESVSLVSLNTHISPFALHADVVVPVATHFERKGSFINESGLTRRFDQVVPPAPGVRSAVDVVAALAALLTLSIDLSSATAREKVDALASSLEGASV
jgi:NADH-quinone oxidoreductase subunit G